MAQPVRSLPTMQKTQVRSQGWEDPLEKETATHSSILAWRLPWTEEPAGLQSMGSHRVRHDWGTSPLSSLSCSIQDLQSVMPNPSAQLTDSSCGLQV